MLYTLGILILAALLSPLYVVIGLSIVLTSGTPILYGQKRIGKNGRPFTMYKFRTMIPRADALKDKYIKLNESDGPVFKIRNDPRFTRLGKILSHTGLDELPQFLNVLHREMSLIGPRPLPVSEAKRLKPWMRVRENVLPGIISPAILTGIYHKNFVAWMRHDVTYVKEKNPMGDVLLFLRSIPFMTSLFIRSILEK